MDTKTADGVVGEVSHAQLRPDAARAGARRRRTRCGTATAREYLDFTSGIAVTSLGHCHPRGDRRHPGGGGHAAARLQHLPHRAAGPPGQAADRALVRRPRVLLQLGRGGQRGGAQGRPQVRQGAAVATDRYEIIATHNSFHGRTLATVSATGQPKYQHGFEPLMPGFKHVPYNDLRAMERAMDSRTAAILVEPIQGEGGVYVPDDGYLRGPAQALRRVRRPADLRRGPDRRRPHGPAVGLRALRASSPTS